MQRSTHFVGLFPSGFSAVLQKSAYRYTRVVGKIYGLVDVDVVAVWAMGFDGNVWRRDFETLNGNSPERMRRN